MDLMNHKPNDAFYNQPKVEPDSERDLFNQVSECVNLTYGHLKVKSFLGSNDQRYPFVIDQQENLKITGKFNFIKN